MVNIYFYFILLISSFVLINIGYYSWKRDKKYISISLLPIIIYEIGYAFEILSSTINWVKFWIKVEYVGIAFLPVAWLMFALNFTGHKDKIKKKTLIPLFIVPVITIIMNYTNDFHHLFYLKLYMNNDTIFPIVEMIKGPFYWVNIAYTYALMLIGLIIIISFYFEATSIVKKQILLLIIAWIIPWISDIVYMLRLVPFDLDLCPLAFAFSGIISSFSILKFKLVKLTPIALKKVFYNMVDGVILLDSENNIVDFNNSSKSIILELNNMNVGGKNIEKVLSEYEDILKAINSDSYNDSLITIKNNYNLRYYKMNINNIYENTGEVIGKILSFNDVTEIEQNRKKLAENLNFLQTLIDAIPNPIYYKDKHRVYCQHNNAFTEFLGIKKENIVGKTVDKIFEKNLAEIYNKSDKDLIKNKGTQVYESKLIHNDGTYHDVIFNKSIVRNGQEGEDGLVGVVIDITEQKKNEEKINKLLKLKESMIKIGYFINETNSINELLQLILDEVIKCIDDRSSGSVFILDEDKNLKIAVARGYRVEDTKNFSIKLEEHFAGINTIQNTNGTVIINGIDKLNGIRMLDTAEGIKIKSVISSPIVIDNELYGFINIDSRYDDIFNEGDLELMEYMRNQASSAITKHILYEEILYLSRYDKLTNTYNRSYFKQLFYNHRSDKKFFYVVEFDLNELKYVNDNYGHSVGDELIRTFSKGLIDLAGDSDIIGRFGGDEFIGVFFNTDIEILIDRFKELIEHFKINPIIFEEGSIVCSFSYGIANYPSDGIDLDKLIKIADKRMYEYKNVLRESRK